MIVACAQTIVFGILVIMLVYLPNWSKTRIACKRQVSLLYALLTSAKACRFFVQSSIVRDKRGYRTIVRWVQTDRAGI